MSGQNVSLIVRDSSGTSIIAIVDHDNRKFIHPEKMMARLREMLEEVTESPRMTLAVSNVVVDSLEDGETISGFATRRFRVSADISLSIEMMGEEATQVMHIESEADYAAELSDFSDPFRDTRGFRSITSGMPWMDSSATAEMDKLMRVAPRGLALRQVDRVTGVTEGGVPTEATTTVLSNIRREPVPPAIFVIPAGYTEMEMPELPEMN